MTGKIRSCTKKKGHRALLRIPTTSSYWKGEVFAYVGLPQNLKDLKDMLNGFSRSRELQKEMEEEWAQWERDDDMWREFEQNWKDSEPKRELHVPDFWTDVWRAVEEDRVEDMRQLLFQSRELIDTPSGPDATTPLMEAATREDSHAARLLLHFGADASAKGLTGGDTALHIAVDSANVTTAELLILHGADTSARNRLGEQPLHRVSTTHQHNSETVRVAQLLLDNGAELSGLDSRDRTPLHRAVCAEDEADLVRFLLQCGATLDPGVLLHPEPKPDVLRMVEEFRVQGRNEALAMGLHKRLGAGSILHGIDDGILRMMAETAE